MNWCWDYFAEREDYFRRRTTVFFCWELSSSSPVVVSYDVFSVGVKSLTFGELLQDNRMNIPRVFSALMFTLHVCSHWIEVRRSIYEQRSFEDPMEIMLLQSYPRFILFNRRNLRCSVSLSLANVLNKTTKWTLNTLTVFLHWTAFRCIMTAITEDNFINRFRWELNLWSTTRRICHISSTNHFFHFFAAVDAVSIVAVRFVRSFCDLRGNPIPQKWYHSVFLLDTQCWSTHVVLL